MLENAFSKVSDQLEKMPSRITTVAVSKILVSDEQVFKSEMIHEQFESILLETGRFMVIDRKSLKTLLEEQSLSLRGLVEESDFVKAGKLIGIQGLFMISIDYQGDKILLNIKCIDVETSAIVFSKKIIGESYSSTKLGFAFGYAQHPGIKSDYRVHYNNSDGTQSILVPRKIYEVAGNGVSLAFTYKAGRHNLQWLKFGVDVCLSAYINAYENRLENSITVPDGHFNFGVHHEGGTGFMVSIEPKVYYSFKSSAGWKTDWLHPYIGAGLNLNGVQIINGGWFNFTSSVRQDNGFSDKQVNFPPLLSICPVIGTEFNVSDGTSFYIQGMINLVNNKLEYQTYFGNDINGWWWTSNPELKRGLLFTTGVKFYFNKQKSE